MDIDKEGIRLRLRDVRKRMKMNQKEFAALLGVSQSAVSSYEVGTSLPDIGNLATLVVHGFDLSWLATGIPSTSQTQSQSMPAAPSLDAPEITLDDGQGRSVERPAAEPEPAPEGAWAPRAEVGPIVRISIAVEGVYRDLGIPVAAHEITRIAVEKYNELLDSVENAEDWPLAIRIMANGLRKEILAAPSATSSTKQRA